MNLVLIILINILFALAILFLGRYYFRRISDYISSQRPIYCLMVTGKDDQRIELAKQSVKNFHEQTYRNKHLIIINHNENKLRVSSSSSPHQICEFMIDKDDMSLGALRNLSLYMVPPHQNAIWTLWDDDDYRTPEYLQLLYNEKDRRGVNCLVFTKRYEYNANTNLHWMMELKVGFKIVMCDQHAMIQYLENDTMEDLELLNSIDAAGYSIGIYENDPKIYVRLVHLTNTSLYVRKNKQKVNAGGVQYKEYDVDANEKKYIDNCINGYLSAIRSSANATPNAKSGDGS